MSVEVMAWVFKHGPTDAQARLVLLAIADHADDNGVAFPSVAGIAEKACVKERGARGIIRRLEDGGWLETFIGKGRGNKSIYRVLMTENRNDRAPINEVKPAPPCPVSQPDETGTVVPLLDVKPAPPCTKTGTTVPPNHQVTIIREEEPIGSLSSADDEKDEIELAVEAYNDAADQVGWPSVRILSKARRSALKARLAECGGLPGWEMALARARAAPWLTGQNDRGWTADFDFLTKQSKFAKLMEGSYDPRPASPSPTTFPGGGGRQTSLASVVARRRLATRG